MATWREFTEQAPQMSAAGFKLLEQGIAYLATLRKDGSPRLHPVCPVLAGGGLADGRGLPGGRVRAGGKRGGGGGLARTPRARALRATVYGTGRMWSARPPV